LKCTQFEQKVERLFLAVESDSATVSWNRTIRDPDTDVIRQIDVEIRRQSGEVIHVECRDRKAKQDIRWIEELIGRKQSLGVDAIIAVSSSGFTRSAIKKAKKYGVIAWNLSKVTPEMVSPFVRSPSIKIPVFRNIFLTVNYYLPDSCLEEGKRELRYIVCQSAKEYLDAAYSFFLRATPPEGSGRRYGQILSDATLLVKCGEVRRLILASYDFEWIPVDVSLLGARMYDDSQAVKYNAAICEAHLEGVVVDVVVGGQNLVVQLDMMSPKLAPGVAFGNGLVVGNGNMDPNSVFLKMKTRPLSAIRWSVPLKYFVFPHSHAECASMQDSITPLGPKSHETGFSSGVSPSLAVREKGEWVFRDLGGAWFRGTSK
jgi:hypothetical protein